MADIPIPSSNSVEKSGQAFPSVEVKSAPVELRELLRIPQPEEAPNLEAAAEWLKSVDRSYPEIFSDLQKRSMTLEDLVGVSVKSMNASISLQLISKSSSEIRNLIRTLLTSQ